MYDVIGDVRSLRRRTARGRAQRSLRQLRGDLHGLRRDLADVREDVVRGVVVQEALRMASSIAEALPRTRRRRRQRAATRTLPIVAAAGLAATGVFLCWDQNRREAMRHRFQEMAGSVSRSTPETHVEVGATSGS